MYADFGTALAMAMGTEGQVDDEADCTILSFAMSIARIPHKIGKIGIWGFHLFHGREEITGCMSAVCLMCTRTAQMGDVLVY